MSRPKSWSPNQKKELAEANFFNAVLQIRNYKECAAFFSELLNEVEWERLNERVTAGLEFANGVPPLQIQSERFGAALMMVHWAHADTGFKNIILRLHRSIQDRKKKRSMTRRAHNKRKRITLRAVKMDQPTTKRLFKDES